MEVDMIVIPFLTYIVTMSILQITELISEEKRREKWYNEVGRQQELDAKIRAEKMPAELKQWFMTAYNIRYKED